MIHIYNILIYLCQLSYSQRTLDEIYDHYGNNFDGWFDSEEDIVGYKYLELIIVEFVWEHYWYGFILFLRYHTCDRTVLFTLKTSIAATTNT